MPNPTAMYDWPQPLFSATTGHRHRRHHLLLLPVRCPAGATLLLLSLQCCART